MKMEEPCNLSDFSEVTSRIIMQIRETEEEFIYERILPYCEEILQRKLSKAELKRILLLGLQKGGKCGG